MKAQLRSKDLENRFGLGGAADGFGEGFPASCLCVPGFVTRQSKAGSVAAIMLHSQKWVLTLFLITMVARTRAIDLTRLYEHHNKRENSFSMGCPPFEPFRCPSDDNCISIQYLCDGAPDCTDGYDEDPKLCTAGNSAFSQIQSFFVHLTYFTARRPPVEETTSFLNSLLASHGPNYLEKLFGTKARHRLGQLGGVDNVAIALSGNYQKSLIIILKHEKD